jgi:hypothetical protein
MGRDSPPREGEGHRGHGTCASSPMGSSSAEQMDELTLRRTASLWLASEEAKGEEDTAAGLARLALDVPFSL